MYHFCHFSEGYGFKQLKNDTLTVSTTLASTKLTQNQGLLRLLKYGSQGASMDPTQLKGTVSQSKQDL